jgi:hypothetical protein
MLKAPIKKRHGEKVSALRHVYSQCGPANQGSDLMQKYNFAAAFEYTAINVAGPFPQSQRNQSLVIVMGPFII